MSDKETASASNPLIDAVEHLLENHAHAVREDMPRFGMDRAVFMDVLFQPTATRARLAALRERTSEKS